MLQPSQAFLSMYFAEQDHVVMATRMPKFPVGAWPEEMRAETAAAYTDERTVEAFMNKVARGIYPQPVREPGCLPKWLRAKLHQAILRRHGLQFECPVVREDVTGLI